MDNDYMIFPPRSPARENAGIDKIQYLLSQYFTWVKNKTTLRPVGEWIEITTPYLDRHNDYLQIYVKEETNGFILTDGGYILTDLSQSGPILEERIFDLINGFGIKLEYGSLTVHSISDNFAPKMHGLIQVMLAMLAVNYFI